MPADYEIGGILVTDHVRSISWPDIDPANPARLSRASLSLELPPSELDRVSAVAFGYRSQAQPEQASLSIWPSGYGQAQPIVFPIVNPSMSIERPVELQAAGLVSATLSFDAIGVGADMNAVVTGTSLARTFTTPPRWRIPIGAASSGSAFVLVGSPASSPITTTNISGTSISTSVPLNWADFTSQRGYGEAAILVKLWVSTTSTTVTITAGTAPPRSLVLSSVATYWLLAGIVNCVSDQATPVPLSISASASVTLQAHASCWPDRFVAGSITSSGASVDALRGIVANTKVVEGQPFIHDVYDNAASDGFTSISWYAGAVPR